jgi:hypothetical protein
MLLNVPIIAAILLFIVCKTPDYPYHSAGGG